jgi:hypothetical protein
MTTFQLATEKSIRDVPAVTPSSTRPRQARAATPSPKSDVARAPRRHFRWKARIVPLFTTLLITVVLCAGWYWRDDDWITPENGLGYWLGWIGGTSMLLLMLYPLRKRIQWLRTIGSVTLWFKTHMILGLLGPVLILFHSNFHMGQINSSIALWSMLLVAGSGIAGRYLYSRLHHGLYGRKAEVEELLSEAAAYQAALGPELKQDGQFVARMDAFSTQALRPTRGVLAGCVALVAVSIKARHCRRELMRDARKRIVAEGRRQGWSWRTRREHLAATREWLKLFFAAVRKAAAFAVFERLFALWHVLHLPLFFLLFVAAVLHVIAVHTY